MPLHRSLCHFVQDLAGKGLTFPAAGLLAAPRYKTIGQFYAEVERLITSLGEEIFLDTPTNQINPHASDFDINDSVPKQVTGVDSAIAAIKVIVEQGEGTADTPLDTVEGDDKFAHYYQFQELVLGKKLAKAENEEGFAWGPDEVEVDESKIYPVVDNPKMSKLDPVADAGTLDKMRKCNILYTDMLKDLDAAFAAGDSVILGSAIGKMNRLDSEAGKLVKLPLSAGGNAGPSFEWLEANEG